MKMRTSKVMEALYKIKEDLSNRHLLQTTEEWIQESNEIARKGSARLERFRERVRECEIVAQA
jgi:hypothetical protein